MRKRIYEIIEKAAFNDPLSKIYDIFMMVTIIISIIPLCFISQTKEMILVDRFTVIIFIADYFLRIYTADFSTTSKGIKAFIFYPFRPMAIIDLISILPSVTYLNPAFRLFKLFRLLKALRLFKFFRYSKNIIMITNVLKREKDALLTVGMLATGYIFISGLIVFQVEPHTFGSLFKAVYWATISLTTVGYGDIYPVSDIGRIISMFSSFLGIAVIALPSGIIITGYQKELNDHLSDRSQS